MTKQKMPSSWIPEILYEENPDGLSSNIPFIQVPEGEEMPKILFIFETRETGEFEPGSDGEEVPVLEMDLKQFVDLSLLKSGLTEQEYDKVRSVLGLEPLRQAMEKGKKITQAVRENVGSSE